MNERGPDRRQNGDRRAGVERRFGERRNPDRAAANRRVMFPFDRRVAERRFNERRETWPLVPDGQEAQAY